MDRVRAELTGFEQTVHQGSVAGVMGSRGSALPNDRRPS
jgi:hypothetical protein